MVAGLPEEGIKAVRTAARYRHESLYKCGSGTYFLSMDGKAVERAYSHWGGVRSFDSNPYVTTSMSFNGAKCYVIELEDAGEEGTRDVVLDLLQERRLPSGPRRVS